MKMVWLSAAALSLVLALSIVPSVYADTADAGGMQNNKEMQGGACHQRLTDDKRQMLHDAMKGVHQKDAALIEEAHKIRHELKDTMTAATFDPKTFTTLSARMADIKDHLSKDRSAALATVLAKFSPEERKVVLWKMKHHHHHHHHHGKWGRNDGAPKTDGQRGTPQAPDTMAPVGN